MLTFSDPEKVAIFEVLLRTVVKNCDHQVWLAVMQQKNCSSCEGHRILIAGNLRKQFLMPLVTQQ